MFKKSDDMQKYGQEQFDAVAAVSTNVSKGMQQIASEASDYAKKSFEAANQATEKLLGAKTFEAAVQVQSEYAKTAYEGFVAQTKKFGELYTTIAKDAYKPMEAVVAKAGAAAAK